MTTTKKTLAINGGTPVRDTKTKPWPHWPIFDHTEEEALLEVLRSGLWWYMGGKNGTTFEKEFVRFQDARYGVACTNGTAALEICLRSLGIGYGDEVIVPPYTFIATASAVLAVGAIPVFVDIEADTLNMDPARIEPAITARTRAIIAVHVAGRPADLDGVIAVAQRHRLAVIEDAAQAHAAAWRGRRVGAIGTMGTFSFQASKNLNSGEGGMILTDDEELSEAAWSVMNVGRTRTGRRHEHSGLGGNYRITEFQAALLRCQMKRLPEQTARRSANGARLTTALDTIEGIDTLRKDKRITTHAYHLYPFRIDSASFGGRSLSDFTQALQAEGIPCGVGYRPLYKEALSQHRRTQVADGAPVRDYGKYALTCPVCEQVCTDTVWLGQTMLLGEPGDMDDVAEAILKIQCAWA
jgi:dTDP-4-amino-4,6-dideoxygalactose transaminase